MIKPSDRIAHENKFRFCFSLFLFAGLYLYLFKDKPASLMDLTLLFVGYQTIRLVVYAANRLRASAVLINCLSAATDLITLYLIGQAFGQAAVVTALSLGVISLSLFHRSLGEFVYSAVLYLCLVFGVTLQSFLVQSISEWQASASVILSAILVFGMAAYLRGAILEKDEQQQVLSRARKLVTLIDLINGSDLKFNEKIRGISSQLHKELEGKITACRIVLSEKPAFMPPDIASLGTSIPIQFNDHYFGAILVTSIKPIDNVDTQFLQVIARCMGSYIRDQQKWKEFREQMMKNEVNELLSSVKESES